MMVRQTLAMVRDAYFELNSKKMFWLVVMGSMLVAGIFGSLGINEDGLKILTWQFDNQIINSKFISPDVFYKKHLFLTYGVEGWLTFFAMILAIVSTGSLMPDFLGSGSIDLLLCKPIGRLRLFLTKYMTGLLFVVLQVFLFCMASIVVIGCRTGSWEWGLLIAVPMVTLFFSYLYCISTFLAITGRAPVATILLTLLFWGFIGVVNIADGLIIKGQAECAIQLQRAEKELKDLSVDSEDFKLAENRLENRRSALADANRYGGIATLVKTFLPKTDDTTDLIRRVLVETAELEDPNNEFDPEKGRMSMIEAFQHQARVDAKADELRNQRSVGWIVGTSLLFEAFVLGLSALIFCRRDF